jgi:hypothetical protein
MAYHRWCNKANDWRWDDIPIDHTGSLYLRIFGCVANTSVVRLMQHVPALPRLEVCCHSWLPEILDREYYMTTVHIPCSGPLEHALPAQLSVNFGNLPFSSAIQANHHPEVVQLAQQRNLTVPTWAMRSINNAAPSTDPFESILSALKSDLAHDDRAEYFCGSHVYVGALDSEAAYHAAPKLSQVAARIVHSIKLGGCTFRLTQYAMMHCYWALLSWMLFPSAESYLSMPDMIRPTPYQLFVAHPRTFDFLILPGLRDFMCRTETPDVRWLTAGARTIECSETSSSGVRLPGARELPAGMLSLDGGTGQLDLNPIYKV